MVVPRGIRNNNPGNLRKTPQLWDGEIKGPDTAFKTFKTAIDGLKGLKRSILIKFARGQNTIRSIITSYAPSSENDTVAYIKFISLHTNSGINDSLNLNNKTALKSFMRAIVLYENGQDPYTNLQYDMAIG